MDQAICEEVTRNGMHRQRGISGQASVVDERYTKIACNIISRRRRPMHVHLIVQAKSQPYLVSKVFPFISSRSHGFPLSPKMRSLSISAFCFPYSIKEVNKVLQGKVGR